jgi:hypothetical protein
MCKGGIEGHKHSPATMVGEISGRQRDWYQLPTVPNQYTIENGCSGSPVCNRHIGNIIGMVAASDDEKKRKSFIASL